MFKEEIQKLATAQVAERSFRSMAKASNLERTCPVPMTAAWLSTNEYIKFFMASDRMKEQRRTQIRIRHLIEAFKASVPYNVLEQKTHVPVYDLACAMITLMRAFGVSHSMEDVYAWLGVVNPEKCYRQHTLWTPKYLGVPQFENVGASVA